MPEPRQSQRSRARVLARLRLFGPLRHRDFALLWAGATASLVGDGIYFVAIAWEVYSLSNAPTALAVVGVAWTLPTVLLLLVGGAVTDRVDRRHLLLVTSLAEAAAIGAIGVLAVTGDERLWMLLILVAIYGAAEAFFMPAFGAIVPTLVPRQELSAAAALAEFVRPLAVQMVGPAVGGVLVVLTGAGPALLVDAGTFLVCAATLAAMSRTAAPQPDRVGPSAPLREIAAGFAFVRSRPWLWATLGAASLSLLAFYGPVSVLLPYLVKNTLHGSGGTFGVIRAFSGIGSIVTAVALAQRGLPRRCMLAMFSVWALESTTLIGFAAATDDWMLAVFSLIGGALAAVGNIIWSTLLNTLVPNEIRGRVSSFDWIVSIGLIPLSFALTGPLAGILGVRPLLYLAGALGAVAMIVFLAVPGVRDAERLMAEARTDLPPMAESSSLSA